MTWGLCWDLVGRHKCQFWSLCRADSWGEIWAGCETCSEVRMTKSWPVRNQRQEWQGAKFAPRWPRFTQMRHRLSSLRSLHLSSAAKAMLKDEPASSQVFFVKSSRSPSDTKKRPLFWLFGDPFGFGCGWCPSRMMICSTALRCKAQSGQAVAKVGLYTLCWIPLVICCWLLRFM